MIFHFIRKDNEIGFGVREPGNTKRTFRVLGEWSRAQSKGYQMAWVGTRITEAGKSVCTCTLYAKKMKRGALVRPRSSNVRGASLLSLNGSRDMLMLTSEVWVVSRMRMYAVGGFSHVREGLTL